MTKFLRIVKFAFQNLWRNLWLTIMTVIVLTFTLLSVNVLLSLNVIVVSASSSLEDRIDVSVYMVPAATPDEVSGLRSYLVGLPQTAEVRTIDPDEALAIFRERHKDDEKVLRALDEVGGNPLGTAFVVRAKSIDQYPNLISALDHPAYRQLIDEKNFEDYRTLIGRIEDIQNKIQQFGIILLALFVLIAIIIMANAVRVAIFTHKEEIGIMKLVGASDALIRWPYIFESILISFFALVIASGLMIVAVFAITPYLKNFMGADPGLIAFFADNALIIILGEFLSLVLLTGIASTYAVGRYMKK